MPSNLVRLVFHHYCWIVIGGKPPNCHRMWDASVFRAFRSDTGAPARQKNAARSRDGLGQFADQVALQFGFDIFGRQVAGEQVHQLGQGRLDGHVVARHDARLL